MWVRCEKRYMRVSKTPLPVGASMEVAARILRALQPLVDSGDLSLHEADPTPTKSEKPPRRKRKVKASDS